MEAINVDLDDRSYKIMIADDLLMRAGEFCRDALASRTRRLAVISNPGVHALYGRVVEDSLDRSGFSTLTYLMGDGERAKSLKTVERVWSFLMAHHFERGDAIVALGGGVVGDLAGFAAACFQRGIEFVQIPTSLLAQIDSSVGGKTAVNHPLGKNMIGAFHQPRCVIIDPQVLRTLPRRELHAGLYEALKYGVIRDAALFNFIVNRQTLVESLDSDSIIHIIRRSCEIKAEVVAADEKESGLRRILNFGHTIGHALEAVTGYRRLKHGEAVGYGMRAAATIAREAGLLSADHAATIAEGIRSIGKLPKVADLSISEIESAMAHDKKASHGKLPFILPSRVGEVVVRDDLSNDLIRAGIKGILRN